MDNLSVKALNVLLKIAALFLAFWLIYFMVGSRLDTIASRVYNNENYIPISQKMKDLECLTKNIYWEAAHEPVAGKIAVAQVTLNRVESEDFADSVCGVVYEKNVFYQKIVCQFSWYCENNHKIKPVNKEMWNESKEVATKVLFEDLRLPSLTEAIYYHADYVNPKWKKPKIEKIGRHIFYKESKK